MPDDRGERLDVATLGEAMAALRCSGSISHGDGLTVSVAGAESNVAIGLARLGHSTAYFGAVGDDAFGKLVRRTLRAEGVNTTGLRTSTDASTGIISFQQPVAGITSVDYYRADSAGASISAEDGASVARGQARIVHLTGITPALSVSAAAATERAMRAARENGALVSFDVNFRSKLWTRSEAAAVLRPLATLADVIVASKDELALVAPSSGATLDEMAESLCAAGVHQVVVKRGARGASLYQADSRLDQDAFPVRAVDTIGAGDAFTAGFLSATLDGLDREGRLDRACTLGAFAVAHMGDWEGLPTRSQLGLLHALEGESLR